eukprot:6454986-Amphidinium_carterae.1
MAKAYKAMPNRSAKAEFKRKWLEAPAETQSKKQKQIQASGKKGKYLTEYSISLLEGPTAAKRMADYSRRKG